MREQRWPFRHEVTVEWRDLDAAGHVNNAVYLSYMESARTRLYLQLVGGGSWRQVDIILARATVDFRSAAGFGETLVVEVRPGRVGESSFVLAYVVKEKETGRLVAEGESVIVCFDYEKNVKKRVPDELRQQLVG